MTCPVMTDDLAIGRVRNRSMLRQASRGSTADHHAAAGRISGKKLSGAAGTRASLLPPTTAPTWADEVSAQARLGAASRVSETGRAGTGIPGPSAAQPHIPAGDYSRLSLSARDGTANDTRKIGKTLLPLHRKAMTWSSAASKA